MIQLKINENDNELLCLNNHQLPIQRVLLDQNLPHIKRLLCDLCSINVESKAEVKEFQFVLEQIKEKQKQKLIHLQELQQKNVLLIEQTCSSLITLKQQINILLDQLLQNNTKWLQSLNQIYQQFANFNVFSELDKFIVNNNYVIMEQQECYNLKKQVQELNIQQQNQIIFNLEKLKDLIKVDFNSQLINQIQDEQMNMKLVDESIIQQDYCAALAFDKSGKTMISTCKEEIRIWNFQEGQLKLVNKLQGHTEDVNCLIFSKFNDIFISGSDDQVIRLWMLQNGTYWSSFQSLKQHNGGVLCMTFSNDETELFSGGADRSIKVWKVNTQRCQLEFAQSLDKHEQRILGLSSNQQQSHLVSCGEDKKILVWEKNQQNIWEFKQLVKQSINEYVYRISFLKNDQFIWISGEGTSNNCAYIFELQNGEFQESSIKTIQLENNPVFNTSLFPIIYNKDKNIFMIKHKFNIYFIREQLNGQYNIVSKIQCFWQDSQGTMTNDYLVVWDFGTKKYTTYYL